MMINHARTLLLNRPADAVTSAIYIEPGFAPVVVPGEFQTLAAAILPVRLTTDERVTLVDALMPVLHAGELDQYTLRFDSRVTYRDQPAAQLRDLCQTYTPANVAASAAVKRVSTLVTATSLGTRLFDWSRYQTDLTVLKAAWLSEPDGLLRFGAAVLAYLYQLERVRRGE